ncbi:2-(3-amino-3-carboxypropyl)histidine synthase subunit 2-like [Convolutriloba macropyga]|uniref:2-(3-amino-3-carboxypropyl)histidine synthase subunit 2-like n=1 Tax=Convolutriloba macropyga TaxID=536237 RepID=UPI003F522CF3
MLEVELVCEQILALGAKVVALQIPGSLLKYAKESVEEIESRLKGQNVTIQVLADNNYSECCIDEITAAHVVACDLIVHYGHCCYSYPSRYTTFVVPPSSSTPVNASLSDGGVGGTNAVSVLSAKQVNKCQEFLLSKVKPGEDTRIFVSDYFQESIMELAKQLQNDQSTRCFSFGRTTPLMKSCCGRNGLFGRQFGDSFTESSVKNVIYIGQSTDRLLQLLCLKFFVASSIYAFDPLSFEEIECMPIVRKLSTKRSHLIERAKEADIIGILIGTLSVRGYRDAIDFSRKLIKLAGKKSYTFVVGKINVAKLANFAEIDAFVLIACPETSLNDHSEFFKPVFSVCELNYALNPEATWDGSFDLDFSSVVNKYSQQVDELIRVESVENFGKGDEKSTANGEIAVRSNMAVMPQTAASFLNSRSWRGLEMKLGESEVCTIEPGLSGIPMKYDNEF